MRADVRRFYHTDLLTLSAPEIVALVNDLMSLDSSTARAVNHGPVWQAEHYLAADLWGAFTGKAHPARPSKSGVRIAREQDPRFLAARERARARARQRARDIDAGVIT